MEAIGLYVGICRIKGTRRSLTFEEAVLLPLPGLLLLPDDVRDNLIEFYKYYYDWAYTAINAEEIKNDRSYMTNVIEIMKGKNQEYIKGAAIARDTFLLHIDLVEDFQRGKFRF